MNIFYTFFILCTNYFGPCTLFYNHINYLNINVWPTGLDNHHHTLCSVSSLTSNLNFHPFPVYLTFQPEPYFRAYFLSPAVHEHTSLSLTCEHWLERRENSWVTHALSTPQKSQLLPGQMAMFGVLNGNHSIHISPSIMSHRGFSTDVDTCRTSS